MNKAELKAATAIARDFDVDLSNIDDSSLFGCGTKDFQPVYVTLEMAAKLIRWQCATIIGGWDAVEFDNITNILRRKAIIL